METRMWCHMQNFKINENIVYYMRPIKICKYIQRKDWHTFRREFSFREQKWGNDKGYTYIYIYTHQHFSSIIHWI